MSISMSRLSLSDNSNRREPTPYCPRERKYNKDNELGIENVTDFDKGGSEDPNFNDV